MKISAMIALVNSRVGNGRYRYSDIEGYFDECIDDINENLYINLPLISEVYNGLAELTQTEIDTGITFTPASIENEYTRLPDAYIRNYIVYEVAYRKLRDEDEVQEVYATKFAHAQKWFKKLVAEFGNFRTADTEAVTVNGDADELILAKGAIDPNDDTALGFYNPMWEGDDV